MKAVGIVVEYNPFHNGHLYHAQSGKRANEFRYCDCGHERIIFTKRRARNRIQMAKNTDGIAGGIDLVVELPYLYSTQKAELFAKGAVSILTEMGVDSINFGSESGNITEFEELVNVMNEKKPTFNRLVKDHLKKGYSYPRAASEAFKQLDTNSSVLSLSEPNNILGYHYVKAIHEDGNKIKATTIHRRQAHYHDKDLPTASIASATSIREALKKENGLQEIEHVMPATTLQLLREYAISYSLLHTWEHYYPSLHYKVTSTSAKQLQLIYECEEGLEYRVKDMMKIATSFHDWMEKMKTKRYTWTRLQRLATHILTNTTKEEMEEGLSEPTLPQIRLLGMNEKGQAFLKNTKKKRQVSIAY